MNWRVEVRDKARKACHKIPRKDKKRIEAVLLELASDPFGGDTEKMGGEKNIWRRRVGSYRLKFELFPDERVIFVYQIERRTSSTY